VDSVIEEEKVEVFAMGAERANGFLQVIGYS